VAKSKDKSGGGKGAIVAVAVGLALASASHHHAAKSPATDVTASLSSTVALGERMAAQRGWTGGQWDCLNELWEKESGWNDDAVETAYMGPGTPTYAYGIPQANPADFGHPYPLGDARPQVAWGLRYVAEKYGTPCSAWEHETKDGWY
jgi:resuscitation-promoting factor RpfB